MASCLAVKGKVEAVIVHKEVVAALGEQVFGAAQDRLGGVFSIHGAGELPKRRKNVSLFRSIALVIEPLGHSVGEEAKFTPSQEAVKAADDDVASTLSSTAPGAASTTRYGGQMDDLLVAFVDSCTLKLL